MAKRRTKRKFWKLVALAKSIREEEIDPLLPALTEARRKYMRSKSDEHRLELERVQNILSELLAKHKALEGALRKASGLPDQLLKLMDQPKGTRDKEDKLLRRSLVADSVPITGWIDEHLEGALEQINRLLPKGWLAEESSHSHRIDTLIDGTDDLSIVKGLRPESEFPHLHRLRQMMRVGQDYISNHSAYDHFPGATLVPQLGQLGLRLKYLNEVGGDVDARTQRLWRGPSDGVDAAIFELLVAARCAEVGRKVEFLAETNDKSPDIRCHDPFPLVIECKRKRALSNYEVDEDAAMRRIFTELKSEAAKRGLWGRFDLRLTVEVATAPVTDIVARLISQRLAPHPDRELEYPWGCVAFHPAQHRVILPGATRIYSPYMLSAVFGWNPDLPEWDGLVCRADGGGSSTVDEIRNPIGLAWSNSSKAAMLRRSWSPLDLFGDAMNQIPPGEYGIIYLAYCEGAREEVADLRIKRFFDKMPEWEHKASIRVPISFLSRLYPRCLKHGVPDLIESTVRLCSGEYGEPALFEEFPQSILTETPRE